MNIEPANHSTEPSDSAKIVVAELAHEYATVHNSSTETNAHSRVPLSFGGLFSWLVIVVITVGTFAIISIKVPFAESDTAPAATSAELMQIQMQGKAIVGQKKLLEIMGDLPQPVVAESADDSVKDSGEGDNDIAFETAPLDGSFKDLAQLENLLPPALDSGPYAQRVCYSILLNELNGPQVALNHLQETDQRLETAGLKLSKDQQRLRKTVGHLMQDYADGDLNATSVDTSDKRWLSEKLGWIGELALYPTGTEAVDQRDEVTSEATSTLLKTGGVLLLGALTAIAGFVVGIVLLVLVASGKLKTQYTNLAARHNIYVETFAVWMVIFFGGQMLLGAVMQVLDLHDTVSSLLLMPVLFFGSLMALVWPVVRGIRFQEVRQDIGWKFGNPFVECGLAAISYAALLPAVMIAFFVVVMLMASFGSQSSPENFGNAGGPSHPIQEFIAAGDTVVISLVFLAACVAAPIVEETMFRGVLYRHLRDWTSTSALWISVAISCLFNSFIFASIHPQGIFGIPLLMTLAIGFSLVREWRGSLLAPMIMHGINNFLVTLFMLVVL